MTKLIVINNKVRDCVLYFRQNENFKNNNNKRFTYCKTM